MKKPETTVGKYEGHALAKALAGYYLWAQGDGPRTTHQRRHYDNPMTDYVNGVIATVKSRVDEYDHQLTDSATLWYYRRKAAEQFKGSEA